jgi:hypothetical protein
VYPSTKSWKLRSYTGVKGELGGAGLRGEPPLATRTPDPGNAGVGRSQSQSLQT